MKRTICIILTVFVAYIVSALGVVYISSALTFRNMFCPGTYIGDVYVGGMDAQNAEKAVFQGMSLKIVLRQGDGYEAINGSEIGYSCALEPSVEDLLKNQNTLLWWKGLIEPVRLEPKRVPKYDENALIEAIEDLKCLHVTAAAPQNAQIVKTETGFEIVPEKEGTQLDHEKVKAVILNAVRNGSSQIDLVKEGCYCEPAVRKADASLNHTLDTLHNILQSTIRINMTGAEESLDKSVFFDWIQYENGSITVDEMELGKYTMDLEEKYKTFRTERDFRTHGRGVITVGGGQEDTYGFWLDREKTTPVIRDALLSGYSQTIEPVWKVSAQTRNGANGDIGRTYVEVCIDEQRLWYYRNGVMAFETPVITGKNIDDTRTPTGVYRVLDCSASTVRISDSTALKSATWRQDSEFNPETYILNGGDKDVELPATAASTLFPYIETGIPVIIY